MSSRSSDAVRIVTIDDVRLVHVRLIHAANAGVTSTSLGPWSQAVQQGWEALLGSLHPVFDVDQYPTLALKAARILYGGSTTQYLVDGNKRLATAVMDYQLFISGVEIASTDQELVEFVLEVSQSGSGDHEAKIARAAAWIDARLRPVVT